MIITVFVFLGIEGASVYSRYAQRREDVGRATVLGFLSVLAIFALVTLLSYGILPRADLAALRQPSMASLLEYVVGHWGAVFISVGVVVSVLGAYLAWTLMAAEVLYIPATMADMPRFRGRQNKAQAPILDRRGGSYQNRATSGADLAEWAASLAGEIRCRGLIARRRDRLTFMIRSWSLFGPAARHGA